MYDFLLCFFSGCHLLCLPDLLCSLENVGKSIVRRLDMAALFHAFGIAFLFLSFCVVLFKAIFFIMYDGE